MLDVYMCVNILNTTNNFYVLYTYIQVCKSRHKECRSDLFSLINTCANLSSKFPCVQCGSSSGLEQPAYVNPIADAEFNPGYCLYNNEVASATCEASHAVTFRLCPCV